MKQSQLFTKTRKDISAEEVSKNAQLLIRAGYIHKEISGVYAFLPLGRRVLNNIVTIIRQEMNNIGGQEVQLTALQNPEVWETSGRWDDEVMDVWFKTDLNSGGQVGLAPTHEEPLTNLMKQHIASYRDLPVYVYQFQTKFRNELRAKSGLMRGREFLMKDLYSFSRNKEEHDAFYERITSAYHYTFERLGIGDRTFLTFASGGSFSKFSHEFQTISDAGEDIVYVERDKKIAINEEVFTDEVLAELGVKKENLEKVSSVEVGNIFTLGTKFSDALHLVYKDEEGNDQTVFMGSYGIGPSRIMGLIAELLADEKGLVWPEEIAPFRVHLIGFDKGDAALKDQIDAVYMQLLERGVEVLYDDRDLAPGEKFADADLIGIPWRVVMSERSLASGGVEIKRRESDATEIVSVDDLFDRFH